MIKKIKCYRLKKDIDVNSLEQYGFVKNSVDNYVRTINGVDYVIYYTNTKRFVLRIVVSREGRARKVGKYIRDLINNDLVEKVNFYEWWAYIGRWQDYPISKMQRIEEKLKRLNKESKDE